LALIPSAILPRNILTLIKRSSGPIQVSPRLTKSASEPQAESLAEMNTSAAGLSEAEAQRRLEEFGPNVVAHEQRYVRLKLFIKACLNPLVILLLVLATITFATAQEASDYIGGVIMGLMVVLGVSLRFVQEARADTAAAKLKAMIRVTATVVRAGAAREIPLGRSSRATWSSCPPAT
jgi:Mg2+-importing ATPase